MGPTAFLLAVNGFLYKKKIKGLQQSSKEIEVDWEKLSDKFAVEKIDTQLKGDVAA